MHATALDVLEASGYATQISATFSRAMELIPGSFADRETAALRFANELVRRYLTGELQRIADGFGAEVTVDGQRYRRHELGEVAYHSLVGDLPVTRHTYRQTGVHNGPTVVPVELVAGLVDGATRGLAYSVAQGYAAIPLREYEAQMAAAHRDIPSRSKLERLAKHIGEEVQRELPVVEPIVRSSESIPDEITSITVGIDRAAAPMAEPRAEEPCRRPRRRGKPYVRRAPDPVDVVYRMAYVGTVALCDANGDAKVVRRFAATAAEGPDVLVARVFDEIEHVLGERPALPIVVVQDGAPELWNLVDGALEARGLAATHRLIDRFHVDEHLAALIASFADDGEEAHALFDRWRAALDRSDTAIDRIARAIGEIELWYQFGEIEGKAMPRAFEAVMAARLAGDRWKEFSRHAEYIRRNKGRMRYATARRHGFAIGSGVTEGACKSVIACRFKRSGQRWSERGLSTGLTLRTLHLSERLKPCFARVAASYERPVHAV
jgi:hypothetical protein